MQVWTLTLPYAPGAERYEGKCNMPMTCQGF